jgi:hypothetical protein
MRRTYRATSSWAPMSVRVTLASPKPAASGSRSSSTSSKLPPRDPVRHPVDPPLAESPEHRVA